MKSWYRLLAVIGGLAILVLAVVYVQNRKTMSARDYYLAILPDPAFATHTPTGNERERLRKWLASSGASDEEIERLARESTPIKQLAPLLDDIIRNLPAKYERVPDVFAGVYPSCGFNARTLQSSGGGYLILISYDLKKSLWEWAKLVINALSLQKGTGLQPDDSMDQIVTAFMKSTREYAQSGIVPKFPQYAADEKNVLVTLLHTAAMEFILAHEYAHVLLGHVHRAPTDVTELFHGGWEQDRRDDHFTRELDADKLAVEIFVGRSSEMDLLKLDPEMQILGIYYSLAIFEALDVYRGGGVRGSAYPGLDRRTRAMRALLKRHTKAVDHPIVVDVMNAIEYLSLHVQAETPGQSALRAGEFNARVAKEHPPSTENPSVQPSEVDVRGLLDARGRSTATQDTEFITFMREFSRTQASNDWTGMRALVSNSRRWANHVNVLLDHAMACSMRGVKSLDLPWSPNQELDAGGFVELAVTILATRQGKKDIQEAVLDGPVRSRVLFVWRYLYGISLGVLGARDDRVPTQGNIEEVRDKNIASLRIAELLQDPILMGFSTLVGAWAFERMGDESRASSLRRDLGDRFEWPPITKSGKGDYVIVYPLQDYLGNKIPTSLEEVLDK